MKRNYKHILFPFVLCGLMAAQTSAAPGIVKGRITDTQGKPVAQVVVTDGRNFTTTDAMGHYRMESDAERQPLVYISTPSAYKLPETDGIADKFYQFQKADSQENIRPSSENRRSSRPFPARNRSRPETHSGFFQRKRSGRHGCGRFGLGCHEPDGTIQRKCFPLGADNVPSHRKSRFQP